MQTQAQHYGLYVAKYEEELIPVEDTSPMTTMLLLLLPPHVPACFHFRTSRVAAMHLRD
jgi:hypothetical protein